MIMKVVVLYRPKSEHSRLVEDYVKDLQKQYQANLDLVSLDTRDGTSTASLYDILENPAILVLANDGQLIKDWQGTNLPLMNELSYYASQTG